MRKFWVPILLLVLLFAAFYPFQIRIAPDWVARVIDESGKPVAEAYVEETWQEYSLEAVGHYDHRTTGSDGLVRFEPHTMHASFASRVSGCFHNLRQSLHSSCGAGSYVHASKCNYGVLRDDWDRTEGNSWQGLAKHMNATLFLRRCPPGNSGLGCIPDDERTSNLRCANKSDR
jgi:hypothetical protein